LGWVNPKVEGSDNQRKARLVRLCIVKKNRELNSRRD